MPPAPAAARPRRLHLLALVLAAAASASPAGPASRGARVAGVVRLAVEGAHIADAGPVVVYLEPRSGRSAPPGGPAPKVHQRDARFSPGFLVVAAGQRVEMPNDDRIFHNVFSYSEPNAFDLGLYPTGESRSVVLRHPGVVRIYCSIHESMNGIIFVAPSPHFARAGPDGRFEIGGVPAGGWLLHVWSERLPPLRRELGLRPGEELRLDLAIGESAAAAAAAP